MNSVVLLRHGETEWSRAHKHTGRADIPLTARGEDQARMLAKGLAGRTFAAAYVSPLQRARRTAELAGFSSPNIDGDLVEWDYGAYEQLLTAEIEQSRPGWNLWQDGAEGGETVDDVGRRVDGVLERLARDLEKGDVAVVAHGHLLRVLTARYLGLAPSAGTYFKLGTGTLSELGREHGRPVILLWNSPLDPGSDLASPMG